jgi:outer membrane protein assembly factor BamA
VIVRGVARRLAVVAMVWLAPRLATALPPDPAPAATDDAESTDETPELAPPSDLAALQGKPIGAVEIKMEGDRWLSPVTLKSVSAGMTFTAARARAAARELTDSGRYARVAITAEPLGDKVALRLSALPRRLIANLTVEGGKLDDESLLAESHLTVGGEVTALTLPRAVERLKSSYARHGFRRADADVEVRETDDPMRVVVLVRIRPGPPSAVAARVFVRDGPVHVAPNLDLDMELSDLQSSYAVDGGDRADEFSLDSADRALTERLRAAQFQRARVTHQLVERGGAFFLYVRVDAGPKFVTRYEGLHFFDSTDLDAALDLIRELDRSVHHLSSKITDFYVRRGFLDVEVNGEERGGDDDRVHVLFFGVVEHDNVVVASREFPCLSGGPLSPADAARDIDSFLEEELPGGALLTAVDPAEVDALIGPKGNQGARPTPLQQNPRLTYVAEIYERALKHLQDFYRSQGYLSATVGPLALVRRRCDRRSPAGTCIPLPLPVAPTNACLFDSEGLPLEEPPPDSRQLCIPDPKLGISCEPRLGVQAPVKLGPRTILYDLSFEGNRVAVEADLAEQARVDLGVPLSQTELESARRRVVDALHEEGFAFADVRVFLDFSADRTRARARMVVSEGERVYVDGIVVRGAKRTNPSLILRRVSLSRCPRDQNPAQCEPYRTSDVRRSEERIASLGTFSSVSIALEDPQVPARRKIVVIDVQEVVPQYLDLRPGISTGEGVRGTIEYGHRNLGGAAVQLTLRLQFGYLPDVFIPDDTVRQNFDNLSVSERLERRNTASIVFPEIGLGPLFRLGLDGIDVRDNERDFGLSKDAAVATLTYRPVRSFYVQLGASLERNDVTIFCNTDAPCLTLKQYLEVSGSPDLNNLLRVPDGLTFAVAERISATWDRRDNTLAATRGTLLVAGIEHVHAYPAQTNSATSTSDFLRFTGTAAAYVRLTEQGLAVAFSVRGGRIKQLIENSDTYPDRLFFLGGVDSLRGFLQDALIPEDIAQQIIADEHNPTKPDTDKLTADKVPIRGGNVFINPRIELRVPLSGIWEGGIFMDSGNVWRLAPNFNPLVLRYTAGAGIRIATPIGPVAFDYGFNLDKRSWEDLGNFHFSIGLF